jgi:hypothetical protein
MQLSALEESRKWDKLPSLGDIAVVNIRCIGLECMVSMFH